MGLSHLHGMVLAFSWCQPLAASKGSPSSKGRPLQVQYTLYRSSFSSESHQIGEMPAFTFILKEDGGSWSAKRLADEEGESLTAEASDSKSLQTELLSLAQSQGASGSLAQSYSPISPSSGVYQVTVSSAAQVYPAIASFANENQVFLPRF